LADDTFATDKDMSLSEVSSAKGAILVWIDPDKEPSKHVMADIPAVKDLVEKWGGGVIFLLAGEKVSPSFKPSLFKNLPGQSVFASDKMLLPEIEQLRKHKCGGNLPVIVITDGSGNLIYFSEGYKIGIGEQIAKAIAPLNQQK